MADSYGTLMKNFFGKHDISMFKLTLHIHIIYTYVLKCVYVFY